MLDNSLISVIFFINLLVYLFVHLPLDFLTYRNRRKNESHSDSLRPAAYKRKHVMVIVAFTTIYFWLLFFLISLTSDLTILYFFRQPIPDNISEMLSITGIIIFCLATIIACLGRISRGTKAISWGIPKSLVTRGMFRFIRHPLYASYIYYFIGISLVFQSLVVIPLLLGVYGYYYSSLYEEEILVEHFGSEYLTYQKKVGRFFPKIKSH
ncbi:MAG: methyltransferase family protein [Candidatus Hodarchaeales archaeon]